MKVAVLALFAVGLILAGCGSAIATHAAAAEATRTLNNEAVTIIESTCRTKALAAASDPDVPPAAAEIAAYQISRTCERIADAQGLFAVAHGAWVGFLLQATRDGDFDLEMSLTLAANLIGLYHAVAEVGEGFGLDLPALPPLFSRLFGGADE